MQSNNTSLVTMFTDAGWSKTHSLGVWAMWAKCNGRTIRHSGQLKGPITQSGHAELAAIANGLTVVAKTLTLPRWSRIIVQTDSEEALLALRRKTHKHRGSNMAVGYILRLAYTQQYKLDLRHIKGHTAANTPRQAVNHWCDTECKRQMTLALRAIQPELNFAA